MKIAYTCRKCETEFEVDVTPFVPAETYGRPEDCYPAEGGEIEPEKCDCGKDVDVATCHETANEKYQDYDEQ